jgi:hypothetical protein
MLSHGVSTIKRPDFGSVLKIGELFLSGVKGPLPIAEVEIPA